MSTEDAYGVELDRRLNAERALTAVIEVVEAYESCGPKQQSTRDVLAAVRAAFEGAVLHGLDNCSQAPARALREAAQFFERDMPRAWGGDATWFTTGKRVADLVAICLRERAADLDADRVAAVRRELSEEPCPACGGSMRFCECMDDPFAIVDPSDEGPCSCVVGVCSEEGECCESNECRAEREAVTSCYTSGGPDPADVDTLRGLLDLMADFPNNDQRARYLLTSNWMRDRLERLAGTEAASAQVAAKALTRAQKVEQRLGRVRGLLAAYGDAEGTPVDYEFLVNQITATIDDV